MPVRLLLAAIFATSFLMPAADAGVVPVGAFNQVSLHGGGRIVLKHGATQSVALIRGSTDVTTFTVRNGRELVIDVCGATVVMCPLGYDLEVEITSPDIQGIALHGGGEVVTEGSFPAQANLAAEIHGGGEIDLAAISARHVDAEIHGGGDIKVTATETLTAEVHGGGDIVFHGHPAVTQSVHGGGSIEGE